MTMKLLSIIKIVLYKLRKHGSTEAYFPALGNLCNGLIS